MECNDARMRLCRLEDVLQSQAYILVYTKIEQKNNNALLLSESPYTNSQQFSMTDSQSTEAYSSAPELNETDSQSTEAYSSTQELNETDLLDLCSPSKGLDETDSQSTEAYGLKDGEIICTPPPLRRLNSSQRVDNDITFNFLTPLRLPDVPHTMGRKRESHDGRDDISARVIKRRRSMLW